MSQNDENHLFPVAFVCVYELVPLLFAEKQFGVVCLFRV